MHTFTFNSTAWVRCVLTTNVSDIWKTWGDLKIQSMCFQGSFGTHLFLKVYNWWNKSHEFSFQFQ